MPVKVTINLNKTPKNSALAVFCYSETEDMWEYVTDATPNGKKATFEVTHFSKYHVMDRTSDFLNQFTAMVKSAKVNGSSDAEVIQAFRDYLVNELHIMDQYTTYNGYWYEPCGLKISGQYKYNGGEGDPNSLIRHEGESNKVGNKYGLCQIDGATSSRDEKHNASETSEIFDVTVIVEYKLIKPDIELTTTSRRLKKGESTVVNVRCHYTNVSNFFEEYKDLELAGYMLTIERPTHFSVDRTSLLTDVNGRGFFRVTANESNQAETINVNFDVSGDFGVHAEGHITLNSEGEDYRIEGTISEEITYTHGLSSENVTDPYTYSQYGTFSVSVSYKFSGSFTKEETGELLGSLTIDNVKAKVSGTKAVGHFDKYAEGIKISYSDADMSLCTGVNAIAPHSPTYGFSGEMAIDNSCVISSSSGDNTIVSFDTKAYLRVKMMMILLGEEIEVADEDQNFSCFTHVYNPEELLLNFALKEGTSTYSADYFKDAIDVLIDDYGSSINDIHSTCVGTTTQTITVSHDVGGK